MGVIAPLDRDSAWAEAGTQLRISLDRLPDRLRSHVVLPDDNGTMVIAGPIRRREATDGSRDIPCSPGEPISLHWTDERGMFRMSGTVLGYEVFDIPCWRIRPSGEPTLEQRRNASRADVHVPVVLTGLGGVIDT